MQNFKTEATDMEHFPRDKPGLSPWTGNRSSRFAGGRKAPAPFLTGGFAGQP
jgi:hypothetical protein